MQLKTIQYQSSIIFYRIVGKGKPVLLIHGFGEDGDIWKNQIDFLQQHCLLLIPDLPGSGKSELINDMSIEGMAESIKALIDFELKFPLQGAEGIGVCLIGHSMGGYISLALAEKYPQSFSSLALTHSSAFEDSEEKKLSRLKTIGFIKKHGAAEYLKAAIPTLFKESTPPDLYKELVEKGNRFTTESLVHYYQAMINRPDRTNILKTFNKPIYFIIGEHDIAIPFEQSLQQCYLPSISHIHILRNSGHMGMLEEAEKVNHILLQMV